MADKFFPLKAGIAFGIDAQGRPVNPSPEFVRQWDSLWKRVGEYTAKTNLELDTDISAVVTAAADAQADVTQALAETAALAAPQYVTLTASGALANERVLTAGANIVLTDGGSTATVALAADITSTATSMTVQPKAASAGVAPGAMTIKARDAVDAAHSGGEVSLNGGAGGASGNGGSVTCSGGSGANGGAIYFTGGDGGIVAGEIYINGGNSYASGGQGGGFQFIGGACTEPGGTGGNVFIASGQGETTGASVFIWSALGATSAIEVTDDGANVLVGLYGASPVAQATTGVAAASFTANAGTAVNDASTFDGYTMKQVVKALRLVGILA